MGKGDFISSISEKTGLTKKDVEAVLGGFSETIKEEVLEGAKEVRLRDFGTFKQKIFKAREGRNPRTGENIQISGSTSVAFSAATAMKVKDT
jgi:DNA-binding protein HU-beta